MLVTLYIYYVYYKLSNVCGCSKGTLYFFFHLWTGSNYAEYWMILIFFFIVNEIHWYIIPVIVLDHAMSSNCAVSIFYNRPEKTTFQDIDKSFYTTFTSIDFCFYEWNGKHPPIFIQAQHTQHFDIPWKKLTELSCEILFWCFSV